MQMKIVKILLVLFLSISVVSCCHQNGMPHQPIKPSIEVYSWPEEEGMCLDKNNTDKLLKYIEELEQGYK
jgi:hypothetical protein